MDRKNLEKAAHFCSYQERTHSEVRNKLFSIGVKGDEAEEIIVNLIQDNFLNEERFAKVFAGSKFRIKNWGRNKILWELQKKGLSSYCLNVAMNEIDEDDYQKKIEDLIEKKASQLSLEENTLIKKNKIYQYLIRKGYESNLIGKKLSEFFG